MIRGGAAVSGALRLKLDQADVSSDTRTVWEHNNSKAAILGPIRQTKHYRFSHISELY